ncbi:hypothetical protein ATSB10_11040 [Dyella thiooxydans]|uniref:VOC domain-containing protein n=1 Tax=Dyella thiooxydans TaxID=445710 RepID=A0A160N056_9GAMM|nr:VOC family protein [Dyella thiooxydans]AND68558.1 hypothetical protein ATSB10_11040 [Dyella thiooxydans]
MKANLHAVHPVLACREVGESVRFYRDLGFVLLFQDAPEAPKYAAVGRDGVEIHLQWADAGQWAYPTDRPVCRFQVDDVDALYEEFVASGSIGEQHHPEGPWARPSQTPWGTREFHLHDPGRNVLQFYSLR